MLTHSESIANISKAIAAAQAEVENATKGSVNPAFKSKYADLAEVLNTVRPVFAVYGVAVTQHPCLDNGVVQVETLLSHDSGEWIKSEIFVPVSKHDAQGVGSAITYARRYALAAVCGVAQEDDDANAAVGGAAKAASRPATPPAPAANKASQDLIATYGAEKQAAYLRLRKLGKTDEEASRAIADFEMALVDKKKANPARTTEDGIADLKAFATVEAKA